MTGGTEGQRSMVTVTIVNGETTSGRLTSYYQ